MNTWRDSSVKSCEKVEQRQLTVVKRWVMPVMIRTEMEKVQKVA